MKKTNKVIAVLAAMVMVLALMAGCGGNNGAQQNSVAGKWKIVSAAEQDEELDLNSIGLKVGMDFKDDGSITIKATSSMFTDAVEQNLSGTWTQDGEDVTVTVDDQSLNGKLEDGKLTFVDGDTSMVLERE